MAENDVLAERFEAHRDHLRRVAYRMLGSVGEADDAVQEAWLRLSRSDDTSVDNLGGWLTTIVGRICLDMLRSRKARREKQADTPVQEPAAPTEEVLQPDAELWLADSVGVALLAVLEMLTPAERIAFVLHDMFDLSFDDIAPIVGRSATATRQLASRARRRVQGGSASPETDGAHQRELVGAFLAASRKGDFQALLALLDPDVVFRADAAAVQGAAARAARGAPALASEVRGAARVAEIFKGRAGGAQLVLVDGVAGAAWAPGGRPRAVFSFEIADGRIVEIELVADPAHLAELDVEILETRASTGNRS